MTRIRNSWQSSQAVNKVLIAEDSNENGKLLAKTVNVRGRCSSYCYRASVILLTFSQVHNWMKLLQCNWLPHKPSYARENKKKVESIKHVTVVMYREKSTVLLTFETLSICDTVIYSAVFKNLKPSYVALRIINVTRSRQFSDWL